MIIRVHEKSGKVVVLFKAGYGRTLNFSQVTPVITSEVTVSQLTTSGVTTTEVDIVSEETTVVGPQPKFKFCMSRFAFVLFFFLLAIFTVFLAIYYRHQEKV